MKKYIGLSLFLFLTASFCANNVSIVIDKIPVVGGDYLSSCQNCKIEQVAETVCKSTLQLSCKCLNKKHKSQDTSVCLADKRIYHNNNGRLSIKQATKPRPLFGN